MIGKAKSKISLKATLGYNEKHDSKLFFKKNLIGIIKEDLKMQMTDLQKCYNGTGKNLTIHAQLCPSIEDGKKLTNTQWQQIANSYIEKMNLSKYQTVGYLHRDKEHVHCHLVINRVNENSFKLYDDSFIMFKSITAADEIAKEMNLIRASEIRLQQDKSKGKNNPGLAY